MLLAAGFAVGYVIKTRKNPLPASQSLSTVIPQQTVPGQKKDEISPDNKDNKITQPEENQALPSEQQNSVQQSDKTNNNKNKYLIFWVARAPSYMLVNTDFLRAY